MEKLLSAGNVLIMTHRRPDGDALGSSLGLRNFLRQCGVRADVLLPDGIPGRFRTLCCGYHTSLDAAALRSYDLFVAVDCANPERLGCGEILSIETLRSMDFISIDHHRGNSIAAPAEWVEPTASSASFMVAKMLIHSGRDFDRDVATLLMTGIMTDTGSFCFANTDAETFLAAAKLMEHGADVGTIANAIFFSKPLNQLHFEAELIERCFKISCDGKFAYAFIPDELMQKYNFDMREDEGLIDLLRGIDGTVIAMLCHRRADGIRISMRSKDCAFPVGPLARKYGGGGHDMAAGTTIDRPWHEVEALFISEVSQILGR